MNHTEDELRQFQELVDGGASKQGDIRVAQALQQYLTLFDAPLNRQSLTNASGLSKSYMSLIFNGKRRLQGRALVAIIMATKALQRMTYPLSRRIYDDWLYESFLPAVYTAENERYVLTLAHRALAVANSKAQKEEQEHETDVLGRY